MNHAMPTSPATANGFPAPGQQLNAEQQEHVITHLSQFDLPADRASIQQSAEAAGWRWEWVWQGQHRAEAMAVLTPA